MMRQTNFEQIDDIVDHYGSFSRWVKHMQMSERSSISTTVHRIESQAPETCSDILDRHDMMMNGEYL